MGRKWTKLKEKEHIKNYELCIYTSMFKHAYTHTHSIPISELSIVPIIKAMMTKAATWRTINPGLRQRGTGRVDMVERKSCLLSGLSSSERNREMHAS